MSEERRVEWEMARRAAILAFFRALGMDEENVMAVTVTADKTGRVEMTVTRRIPAREETTQRVIDCMRVDWNRAELEARKLRPHIALAGGPVRHHYEDPPAADAIVGGR